VSTSGGSFPRWRKGGRELFYRALDGRLMAVSVATAAERLEFGAPVASVTQKVNISGWLESST